MNIIMAPAFSNFLGGHALAHPNLRDMGAGKSGESRVELDLSCFSLDLTLQEATTFTNRGSVSFVEVYVVEVRVRVVIGNDNRVEEEWITAYEAETYLPHILIASGYDIYFLLNGEVRRAEFNLLSIGVNAVWCLRGRAEGGEMKSIPV